MADDADPIRAAGALVWQSGPGGQQLALVHRPRYDDWSFPKGKVERGEHLLRTAIREVAEETGLRVVLGRPLRPSVYQVGDRAKRVSYWTARCTGSDGFVAGREVDELAWLDAGQTRERLSYQRDLTLLEEFESGPVRTVPFILLRHASAGVRQATGTAGGSGSHPLETTRLTWPGRLMPAARPTRNCWPTCWPATGGAGWSVRPLSDAWPPCGRMHGPSACRSRSSPR